MSTTLLKLATAKEILQPTDPGYACDNGRPEITVEELMATLPASVRDKIKQAADEMVQSMPPLPGLTPFVRGVLVNQAHKMAVEFSLFGHKLGYDQGVWEANEGVA